MLVRCAPTPFQRIKTWKFLAFKPEKHVFIHWKGVRTRPPTFDELRGKKRFRIPSLADDRVVQLPSVVRVRYRALL